MFRPAQVVLKSQILAGGRGLGTFTNGLKGGVHICKAEEAPELAKKMLGATLVTKQVRGGGWLCSHFRTYPSNVLEWFSSINMVTRMQAFLRTKRVQPGEGLCSGGGLDSYRGGWRQERGVERAKVWCGRLVLCRTGRAAGAWAGGLPTAAAAAASQAGGRGGGREGGRMGRQLPQQAWHACTAEGPRPQWAHVAL